MLDASETIVASHLKTTFAGRDIVLATWRGGSGRAPEEEAGEAYSALAATLRAEGCAPVQERVFGDLAAAPAVARGRARATGDGAEWAVPATYVEGSPVGRPGLAGVHVVAVRGASRVVAEGERAYGRVVEGNGLRVLGLSDVGRRASSRLAPGPAEDAAAAIDAAEELLAREGFSFRDVARTWIYLRDILDWYGPFNAVRNAAFRRMGLLGAGGDGKIPASTGIEGRNARGGWCALDLLALRPSDGGKLEVKRLHNRRQSEATDYGSAFARATEVSTGGARTIFVSGTASIDDHGKSMHAGDFETQTRYTLDAVDALLDGAGSGLADVVQATAFLKNPCDGRSFDRLVERSPLRDVPLVTTVADVCRPELLFEIDATVVVRPRRGARR
ncbi:MAG TPA: Rid family hydrolase [Vicinamibacteria bacterium]|nr:Rid family hydrolase [Vicinamibacteria bacterium]